jgi:thymidylate synthase (FAD)
MTEPSPIWLLCSEQRRLADELNRVRVEMVRLQTENIDILTAEGRYEGREANVNLETIAYLSGEALSTGATVSLIACTRLVDGIGIAPEGMTDGDALSEFAGRICYGSEERMGTAPDFVATRIAQGHESIIEHGSATFLIDGCSRICSHQLVRHRLASYSQLSQRFVDLTDLNETLTNSALTVREVVDAWCVIPPTFGNSEVVAMYQAILAYISARERGERKEDARGLLPQWVRTRLVMSANFREWRHIIAVRCDKAAQWEIKEIAQAIRKQLEQVAPGVFSIGG